MDAWNLEPTGCAAPLLLIPTYNKTQVHICTFIHRHGTTVIYTLVILHLCCQLYDDKDQMSDVELWRCWIIATATRSLYLMFLCSGPLPIVPTVLLCTRLFVDTPRGVGWSGRRRDRWAGPWRIFKDSLSAAPSTNSAQS